MTTTRRQLLQLAGGALAAPLAAAPATPNVLLIISDQIHHQVLGAAGNPIIKTPNIDRLAREGVRFTHAVCPTPFCSPTRASMLSGLYPHKHGIVYNVNNMQQKVFDDSMHSTEKVLAERGYRCSQRGKWHLGDKRILSAYKNDPPADQDRDDIRKIAATLPPPAPGQYVNEHGQGVIMKPVIQDAIRRFEAGGEKIHFNAYMGRVDFPNEKLRENSIADQAVQQMRQFGDKPFFMTVSFPAPHAPWTIGEPYYSMYERSRFPIPANSKYSQPGDRETMAWRFGQKLGDEGMREYLGIYYGMVTMMDAAVGRVLATLREIGADDNTLVIFTADHGDMQGGHGMWDKMISTFYDELTRIPLILRLPGNARAGTLVHTPSSTCDIDPTILDLLGLPVPAGLHGRSLRPFIEGKSELERQVFCERTTSLSKPNTHFHRALSTTEWKYDYQTPGGSQLFHVSKDPGETKNLIDERSARPALKTLHASLRAWMRDTGDPKLSEVPESM